MVIPTSVLSNRRIVSYGTLEVSSRLVIWTKGIKFDPLCANLLLTSRLKPCSTMTKQFLVQTSPCPAVAHAISYTSLPPVHRSTFGLPSTLNFDKLSSSHHRTLSQSSGRTSHSEYDMVSREPSSSTANPNPSDLAVPTYHTFSNNASGSRRYTHSTPPPFPLMRSHIDSPCSTLSSLLSRPRKGSQVTSISIPASPEPLADEALMNTRPPTPLSPETKCSRHHQFYYTNHLSIFDVCVLALLILEYR